MSHQKALQPSRTFLVKAASVALGYRPRVTSADVATMAPDLCDAIAIHERAEAWIRAHTTPQPCTALMLSAWRTHLAAHPALAQDDRAFVRWVWHTYQSFTWAFVGEPPSFRRLGKGAAPPPWLARLLNTYLDLGIVAAESEAG